jgi:glycosyltransferase involved in cell wall biosynthesis
MQIEITALILTYNEAPNIVRTLRQLTWAKSVLIVDSGSTDQTLKLARATHSNIKIVTRPFDSFAGQCNFGLSQIDTKWVLSLDADYVLTPELVREIAKLDPSPDVSGYSVEFRYCIQGRPLRSTVYPARTVLYRRNLATYRDEGHGHRVNITGKIEKLAGKIDHDDRKPFSRWLNEQKRYAKIEARHLLEIKKEELKRKKEEAAKSEELATASSSIGEQGAGSAEELSFQDRLRLKIFFAGPAMFFYLLFVRGLILDGWPGWVYVAQRTIAEVLLSYRLVIEKISNRGWSLSVHR